MKMPVMQKRKVLRYSGGNVTETEDPVVTEHPVTIKLNGEEFATLVCTPEYIEDMAVGFLASEGVITRYSDIVEIWIREKEGYVHVNTKPINPLYKQLHSKRYITSCCGVSRQSFIFMNDARTVKKMNQVQQISLSEDQIFNLMESLQSSAELFELTGGVHNAALCDSTNVLLQRQDIGRHNALDKIYGHCLKHQISMAGKAIAFSGRISSEILLKVAKIGCEIILSKSAPTDLALELAEELGITTVGFIRNGSFNIYTHPRRINGMKGLKTTASQR